MSKQQKQKKEQERDILQAVVVADDFTNSFYPICANVSKYLMPIADQTLLDNSLQALHACGFEQAFVFTSQFPSLIREHVEKHWSSASQQMEVIVVQAEKCCSLGDVLRDIDSRHIVPADFVLLYGDTITNVNFKQLLEQFKERRTKEKKLIMACVMRQLLPGHSSRQADDDIFIVTKPDTQQLLLYQQCTGSSQLDLPMEFLAEHSQVQVRHDLVDCHIALCSPYVPSLFTDNFDFQTIEDFIKGILMNEEILGYTLTVEVIKRDYVLRMSNLHMLHIVGLDMLRRWPYPAVPDFHSSNYSHQRHNIYLHKESSIAGNAELKEDVLIGQKTAIGEKCAVSRSIIGRNCTIGKDVTVEHCYIMNHVTIGDACQLRGAFIGSDVTIQAGASVPASCVLGSSVKIGRDAKLSPGIRIINRQGEAAEADVVGKGGEGQVVKVMPGEDGDEDDWGEQSEDEVDGGGDDDEEEDDVDGLGVEEDDVVNEFGRFCKELMDTLQNNTSTNVDNQVIEVNGLKSAFGLQIRDVRRLLVKCVVELPINTKQQQTSREYIKQFESVIKKFTNLLKKFVRSPQDQNDGLEEIGLLATKHQVILMSLPHVLHLLYDEEIISEQVFLTWHDDYVKTCKDDEIKKKLGEFAEWLKNADESEED